MRKRKNTLQESLISFCQVGSENKLTHIKEQKAYLSYLQTERIGQWKRTQSAPSSILSTCWEGRETVVRQCNYDASFQGTYSPAFSHITTLLSFIQLLQERNKARNWERTMGQCLDIYNCQFTILWNYHSWSCSRLGL